MAGLVVALRRFAGIEVDAIARRVAVAPCVPKDWPCLSCMARVGKTRFEVDYRRESDEQQRIEVRPAGRISAGYVLRLGARTARRRPMTVEVNGRALPAELLTVEESTLWAEFPFTGPVKAAFRTVPG
jgi:hypothetical protein